MTFLPYLNFDGNCREAFTRYQEIFGGELIVMTAGDVPGDEAPPAETADLVIHAALRGDDAVIMASDSWPGQGRKVQGMYVNYWATDTDDAKRVFDALADGGETEVPFGPTFFSPGFGVCVDRFGTPWMINVPDPSVDERATRS